MGWPSACVNILLEDTLSPPMTVPFLSPLSKSPPWPPSHSNYPNQLIVSNPAHPPLSKAPERRGRGRKRRRRGRSYHQLPGRVRPETYLPNGHRQPGSESPPWARSPGAGHGARQHPPPPFPSCPPLWKPQTPLCTAQALPTLSQELAPGMQRTSNLVVSCDRQLPPYPPTPQTPTDFTPLLTLLLLEAGSQRV